MTHILVIENKGKRLTKTEKGEAMKAKHLSKEKLLFASKRKTENYLKKVHA